MPTHTALVVFVVGLVTFSVVATRNLRARADLRSRSFWTVVLAAAGIFSLVSCLRAGSRHAGTGVTTSSGWPKSFYFQYVSEAGEQSKGWSLLCFAANTAFYAGSILLAWAVWRLYRHLIESPA